MTTMSTAALTLFVLEAQTVAIEQVLWAAAEGWTPRETLLRFGMDWPERSEPNWHDCVRGLAIAWRRLDWAKPKQETPIRAARPVRLRRAA